MDDQELIGRYLNGDLTAFNDLVRRHHSAIYNFLLKLVANRDDAADLCQDVFLRCYRKLDHLREREKFDSWLYTIAVNRVRDHWRRQQKIISRENPGWIDSQVGQDYTGNGNPLAGRDSTLQNHPSGEPSPERLLEAEYRAELVRNALSALPLEQREVLVLKIFQGLKFREIADAVQAPLNTVKSRLYYGLAALREKFRKYKLEDLYSHEV